MLQGTGSDVGKSLLIAGLARLLTRRGLAVRPFKPQNMSNNAAATPNGGEIGRAQALQARAAGVAPSVHMNPVLLKPQSEVGAQVVVRGRVRGNAKAREYQAMRGELLQVVLDSYRHLAAEADIVLVEGAGSAAEVNLRPGDIANMGFATAAGVPVVLVGDIDRGGVIASLVGTHALLPEAERTLLRGYVVNRFRGDIALFDGGIAAIGERTGWPCLGVVPWFSALSRLPAEDAMTLERQPRPAATSGLRIAVPRLSRIANFDDFDPLRAEPGVALEFIDPGRPLPGDADLVILPGSKATLADLAFLRRQGWDIDLAAHVRRGGKVLGICAGLQMLGNRVADPDGLEGPPGAADGLGLLDLDTVLSGDKRLLPTQGTEVASGEAVSGYEMHMGRSSGPALARPMLTLAGQADGAVSADGRIMGCYLHGLFAADGFRRAFLARLGHRGDSDVSYEAGIDATLDAWADHLEAHLDIEVLLSIAGTSSRNGC